MTSNQALTDNWTVAHTALGGFAAAVGVPALPLLAATVGYEVVEQIVERTPVGQRMFRTPGPESPQNALADLAVTAAAYALVRFVRNARPGRR